MKKKPYALKIKLLPRSTEAFELGIQDFLDRFTNYGCYCWIIGPLRGVIGGGQVVSLLYYIFLILYLLRLWIILIHYVENCTSATSV